MAEIKITESNFEAEVLKADQPVLLDFLGNLVRTGARCWLRFLRRSRRSMKAR